jgi:hypothetical protein
MRRRCAANNRGVCATTASVADLGVDARARRRREGAARRRARHRLTRFCARIWCVMRGSAVDQPTLERAHHLDSETRCAMPMRILFSTAESASWADDSRGIGVGLRERDFSERWVRLQDPHLARRLECFPRPHRPRPPARDRAPASRRAPCGWPGAASDRLTSPAWVRRFLRLALGGPLPRWRNW